MPVCAVVVDGRVSKKEWWRREQIKHVAVSTDPCNLLLYEYICTYLNAWKSMNGRDEWKTPLSPKRLFELQPDALCFHYIISSSLIRLIQHLELTFNGMVWFLEISQIFHPF